MLTEYECLIALYQAAIIVGVPAIIGFLGYIAITRKRKQMHGG